MAQDHTRSLYDIKREAEQTRAELADTVDQLRASVAGARDRLTPDSLKAEFSDFARGRGEQLLDAARRNPAQTAALGALVAWPALAIARAIPLPVALIGAGLFLTGTRTGRELVGAAGDRAADFADEANRRVHDMRDASSEALGIVADQVADAATRVATSAKDAAGSVTGRTAPALDGARHAGADFIEAASRSASAASDALSDIGGRAVERGRDAFGAARSGAQNSGQTLGRWAMDNPLLVGGLGLLVGGFVASAFPATAAERSVAGAVGIGVKTGLRAAAAQGMATAAGAAVRAAASGLQTNGAADAAAPGAFHESETGPEGRGARGA